MRFLGSHAQAPTQKCPLFNNHVTGGSLSIPELIFVNLVTRIQYCKVQGDPVD